MYPVDPTPINQYYITAVEVINAKKNPQRVSQCEIFRHYLQRAGHVISYMSDIEFVRMSRTNFDRFLFSECRIFGFTCTLPITSQFQISSARTRAHAWSLKSDNLHNSVVHRTNFVLTIETFLKISKTALYALHWLFLDAGLWTSFLFRMRFSQHMIMFRSHALWHCTWNYCMRRSTVT